MPDPHVEALERAAARHWQVTAVQAWYRHRGLRPMIVLPTVPVPPISKII